MTASGTATYLSLARRLGPALPELAVAALRSLVPGDLDHRRQRNAATVSRVAARLGGLVIKAGQALAVRADLFPREWVTALAWLENQVPPLPFAPIARHLERELGRPLSEVFAELESAAVAAASLAQVHRGRLRDGRLVAVKVLYPGIERRVARDLALLPALFGLLIRDDARFEVSAMVAELTRVIPDELDLTREGRNAERIASLLAHRDDVRIPRIVWEWTTRRVLVMEFVDGIKITDVAGLQQAGIDLQAVARLLVDVYGEQIFAHGEFHADPHPGNLFVLPGPRLTLLDFGLVMRLSDDARQALGTLLRAVIGDDGEATESALRRLGFQTTGPDRAPLLALAHLLFKTLADGRGYADPQRVKEAERRLLETLADNRLVVPSGLTLVARVMGALSGIGRQLDSRINVYEIMLRHLAPNSARPLG